MFSVLSEINFIFGAMFELSANVFNFDKSNILSFGRVFFRVRGRHPPPVKRGKMHDKGHIWGKFSVNVVLHHFIFV